MRRFFTIAALIALSACAVSDTTFPNKLIDDRFGGGSFNWNSGPSVAYRLGIFNDEGTYVVCAAIQNIRRTQDRQLLSAFRITANGQALVRNLYWAAQYPGTGDLTGREANCIKTTVPYMSNANYDVEFTQTSFRRGGFE